MSRPSRRNKTTDLAFDRYIGKRLKDQRQLLGLSQAQVANLCNVTYQQIQKYEAGHDHLSVSRIFQLAQILNLPVSYFFEGTTFDKLGRIVPEEADINSESIFLKRRYSDKREIPNLIHIYYSIKNDKIRRNVYELMKSLAKSEPID